MKALLLFSILLVIDATKISPEENKKLRTECGPLFKSSASASSFPLWLYSMRPNYANDRLAGVIISSKHILVHHSWKHKPLKVEAATAINCYDDEDNNCKFKNLTLRYISNGLRIYDLDGDAKFTTTPICLPRNLTGAEETNLPNGHAKVFDKAFPKKKGKLNSANRQIITRTDPFQTNGEGKGAIVGSHTGKAFLIGFDAAAGQKNMLDMRKLESDICSTTGVCHNKKFEEKLTIPPDQNHFSLPATTPPPTTTIPTSTTQLTTTEATTPETTPEHTTTEAPPPPTTTKAPKKPKKPKKNKNGKEQLPFEYDQEDFIYWPEETTKTANWKGTLWVTVAVAFWL